MADDNDPLPAFREYLEALEEEARLSCVAEILASQGKSRRVWVETLDATAWVFEFLRGKAQRPPSGGFPQLDRGPVLAWVKRFEQAMTVALVDTAVRFKTENRIKALKVLDRLDDVFSLIEKPANGV
jgi:hypothetical protein